MDSGLSTLYAVCYSRALLPGNATTEEFEAFDDDNYADHYVITATEIAETGIYWIEFPDDWLPDLALIDWHTQDGATPAQSDTPAGVTGRMQAEADLADGGRLDLLVDGVLEDTGTTLPNSIAAIPTNPLLTNDTRIPATAPPTNAQFELRTKLATDYADKTTLDTAAANQATLLNRIGAFTGSGVNTILGFLRAIMSKTANTPSDVGGTFSAATDSVEANRDATDTISLSLVPSEAGATQYIECKSTDGNPVQGVTVWITEDEEGTDIYRMRRYTGADGKAAFPLPAGTYWVWREYPGVSISSAHNPQSITVT